MKSTVLASLLLLTMGNALGISITKNKITIEYKKCFKYRPIKFGLPYCIHITNRSQELVIINPSIVSAPLRPYQEVAKALRKQTIFFTGIQLIVSAAFIGKSVVDMDTYHKDSTNPRISPRTVNLSRSMVGLDLAMLTIFGGHTAYLLSMFSQFEFSLQKEVLHSQISLLPGQSIKKLFWLKNPKDHVEIDFGAIKVLNAKVDDIKRVKRGT